MRRGGNPCVACGFFFWGGLSGRWVDRGGGGVDSGPFWGLGFPCGGEGAGAFLARWGGGDAIVVFQ